MLDFWNRVGLFKVDILKIIILKQLETRMVIFFENIWTFKNVIFLIRSTDEEQVLKLRKDLKKTKALLKDAQSMLERSRAESSNKVVLRQLRNQLEDADFARTSAIKAKQNAELELSEVQAQLDDVIRSKCDVEDKLYILGREKADLSTQLESNEEELQEVMKKYKVSTTYQ